MTGAARGIGAACVEAFRGAGYKVVALERFGRLDHALGNAGVTLGKLIDDTVDDELERLWRVNVKGLVHLAQAVHAPLAASLRVYGL